MILKLPAPVLPVWRTNTIFGNDNPLEIDAGSGKGRFLLARASTHPKTNFIAIEHQNQRILKVARKAARANCNNVRLVKADIAFVLQNLIEDNAIRTLYVFYPDPWPKRRHHKRRLIQTPFLDLVAQKLMPGGKMHFATDDLPYAEYARDKMQQANNLHTCDPFIPLPEEKTDFELIFERQGIYANRFSLQKPTLPVCSNSHYGHCRLKAELQTPQNLAETRL